MNFALAYAICSSCVYISNIYILQIRIKITPFNIRVGTVMHLQDCFRAREDRESSFHQFGSPVRLVQACLCAEKTC